MFFFQTEKFFEGYPLVNRDHLFATEDLLPSGIFRKFKTFQRKDIDK